jgi:hypothetical protein
LNNTWTRFYAARELVRQAIPNERRAIMSAKQLEESLLNGTETFRPEYNSNVLLEGSNASALKLRG